MIKALIFDMDDTLLKTQQTKFAALQALAKNRYNLSLSDDHLRSHWGKPMHTFMADAFHNVDTPEQLVANYMDMSYEFKNEAYEDAYRAINRLYPSYELGILSSASRDLIIRDITRSTLDISMFAYIQGSDETKIHKPDPGVFDPALDWFLKRGVTTAEIMYIGDTLNDYLASSAAGLQFVGIPRDKTMHDLFKKRHARTLSSLDELPGYLEAHVNESV